MNSKIEEVAKEFENNEDNKEDEYSEISSPNFKAKDSVFYNLFQIKENVLQLYKELHPEDKDIKVNDIKLKTLTAIFVNYLYNDLGFMVNRKGVPHYIILVEAQSKWNRNITMRILWYLAVTYHRFVRESGKNIHDTARIDVPAPELYLVYTGDDLKNVPDEINIRDEMFGGEGSVDIKVKVLHAPSKTILGQYIAFSKIYNEQFRLYGRSLKAAEETIRICLERGILVEFLTNHRQEVVTMLMTLFNEKIQREEYDESLRKKSIEEGIEIGEKKGRAEGIEIGEKKGMISALSSLVEKGLLTLAQAANEANMSETEFERNAKMQKA